jgi:DNA-binding beta-propeller fold protein YncE
VAASPAGGTVFVTGFMSGVTSGFDYATVAYSAATGAQLWVSSYNGPGNGDDEPAALAVSPDGGTVFVTGYSTGADSETDYATVAYDAVTGAQLWGSRYHGPGEVPFGGLGDEAVSLAVSPDGGTVFITGFSAGATSGLDYATIGYDAATGAQRWVSRYDGPAGGNDLARSVAVSPGGGTVYVTGTSPVSATSVRNAVATVAYDAATGARRWVRRYAGSGFGAGGFAVAAGPGGRQVYVTGYARGPSAKSSRNFATIAYHAATGAQRWVSRYNGPARLDDIAVSLAVSPGGGTVYVTGPSQAAKNRPDYTTVAYHAATGAQRWARRYRGPVGLGGFPYSVAAGPGGRTVYVTGSANTGPRGGPSTGSDYATIAYAAATGARIWARLYNAPGNNGAALSVAVSRGGRRVFVTGSSVGTGRESDYATVAYRS